MSLGLGIAAACHVMRQACADLWLGDGGFTALATPYWLGNRIPAHLQSILIPPVALCPSTLISTEQLLKLRDQNTPSNSL